MLWIRPSRVASAAVWLIAGGAALLAASAQAGPSNAVAVGGESDRQASSAARDPFAERAWRAALSVFVDYDSNVGLTEEDAPAPYAYEPAVRAGLAAVGSYSLLATERFEAGVGGTLAQTTTHGDSYADEYDLTTVSPRLYAATRFSLRERPARVQLDYRYRRDWLEGDDFERSHGSRISASVLLTERVELGAHYTLDLNSFDASGFHALDDRRDAEHHRVGARATWTSEDQRQSFGVAYEFLRNLADERDFDFEGHGFSGRFRTLLPVPIAVGLDLLASYTDADYIHYTTAPQREARTQYYRAALTLPLRAELVSSLSYAYLRIGADQARFRSERHLVSAAVTYHFQ
jgi:hypothetical protein